MFWLEPLCTDEGFACCCFKVISEKVPDLSISSELMSLVTLAFADFAELFHRDIYNFRKVTRCCSWVFRGVFLSAMMMCAVAVFAMPD